MSQYTLLDYCRRRFGYGEPEAAVLTLHVRRGDYSYAKGYLFEGELMREALSMVPVESSVDVFFDYNLDASGFLYLAQHHEPGVREVTHLGGVHIWTPGAVVVSRVYQDAIILYDVPRHPGDNLNEFRTVT